MTDRIVLTIPARINVLGNPTDANEGDFATISAAVELRAGAFVEPAEGLIFDYLEARPTRESPNPKVVTHLEFPSGWFPLPYDGSLDLLKGAVNRLYRYSPEFRDKYLCRGVRIAIWSDVPKQSGLGGSSLLVLLALGGLREFYNLDRRIHNDYVVAELTQRVEAAELGITAGYADRYIPLFGGIAYMDYRAKLYQRPIGEEPFTTVERLDSWVKDLPLVAVCTGIPHDSGDVHGRMRPRYLEEQAVWEKSHGELPPMLRFMTGAWESAWRGKIALLQEDWPAFGCLMNENHRLVNEMMVYCGFVDGAGWANNILINAALRNGALGAKLTGAGGGGSVFALVQPGEEQRIIDAWGQIVDEQGLKAAWIYRPRIALQGLTVARELV